MTLVCLPFTGANRSVHGLGKWFAKFRTGKFRPEIAFTVCTNQFHLPKNDREGLKPVSKMALKKWNSNFHLENSVRKNRTTFSDVLLLPGIFRWNDPKSRVPFTFQQDFPANFGKSVNNLHHQGRLSKRLETFGRVLGAFQTFAGFA